MLKKIPKVAVLRSVYSDLGRDYVYSNEMHSVRLMEKFLWPEWFNLVLLTFSWVETNRGMSISDFLPFCLTLCECFAILALDGWKNEYLSIIFSLCWSSRRYEWKTVVYKSYDRNILIQYLYQISNWIVFEEKKYCTFGL